MQIHLQAENEHRLEDTLATLTTDCVFEDRALGRVFRGRAGAGAYYQLWWEAIGANVRGERLLWTDDGGAVAEFHYGGIHSGPFLEVPPTGRPIDLPVAVFITFREGLLAGERFYYDLASLLRQLGVQALPTTAAANDEHYTP